MDFWKSAIKYTSVLKVNFLFLLKYSVNTNEIENKLYDYTAGRNTITAKFIKYCMEINRK